MHKLGVTRAECLSLRCFTTLFSSEAFITTTHDIMLYLIENLYRNFILKIILTLLTEQKV